MSSLFRNIKDWFGYTRRERRSSFILLIIIFIIIVIRHIAPAGTVSIEKIPVIIPEIKADTDRQIRTNTYRVKSGNVSGRVKHKAFLELNSCDSIELKALPGIGPVLSVRIIKYRNLIGGFVSVDQLHEVYGLKEETFSLVESRVKADSTAIRKIKINKVAYKDLIRHPYFTQKEVTDILKFRELKGRITGFSDIRENNLISPENLKRIRAYLDFGE